MFLIAIARLVIVIMMFWFLVGRGVVEWNMEKPIRTFGFSMGVAYLLANIMVVVCVLFKMPAIDSKQVDMATTDAAKFLYGEQITKRLH